METTKIKANLTNNEHDGSFGIALDGDNASSLDKFKYIVSLLSNSKEIDTMAEKYDTQATNKIYHNQKEYKQAIVETLISIGKEEFNNINLPNKELAMKHMGGILSDIAEKSGQNISSFRWLDNLYQSCAKAIGYKTGREKAKEALVESIKSKTIASEIEKTLRNHQAHDNGSPIKKGKRNRAVVNKKEDKGRGI